MPGKHQYLERKQITADIYALTYADGRVKLVARNAQLRVDEVPSRPGPKGSTSWRFGSDVVISITDKALPPDSVSDDGEDDELTDGDLHA